jgi:hypothetical protein
MVAVGPEKTAILGLAAGSAAKALKEHTATSAAASHRCPA